MSSRNARGQIALVAAGGQWLKWESAGPRQGFTSARGRFVRRFGREEAAVDALNSWDVALFVVAGYIAVVSLVRLMLGRRNTLARQVRDELERQSSEAQRQAEETEQNRPAQTPVSQAALAAKKKA